MLLESNRGELRQEPVFRLSIYCSFLISHLSKLPENRWSIKCWLTQLPNVWLGESKYFSTRLECGVWQYWDRKLVSISFPRKIKIPAAFLRINVNRVNPEFRDELKSKSQPHRANWNPSRLRLLILQTWTFFLLSSLLELYYYFIFFSPRHETSFDLSRYSVNRF